MLTMNSVKILHAVRLAITATAELLVNSVLLLVNRCTTKHCDWWSVLTLHCYWWTGTHHVCGTLHGCNDGVRCRHGVYLDPGCVVIHHMSRSQFIHCFHSTSDLLNHSYHHLHTQYPSGMICFACIESVSLGERFSTGVPRNLRVLPVLFKGSAGPPVLSKKIELCLTFGGH